MGRDNQEDEDEDWSTTSERMMRMRRRRDQYLRRLPHRSQIAPDGRGDGERSTGVGLDLDLITTDRLRFITSIHSSVHLFLTSGLRLLPFPGSSSASSSSLPPPSPHLFLPILRWSYPPV